MTYADATSAAIQTAEIAPRQSRHRVAVRGEHERLHVATLPEAVPVHRHQYVTVGHVRDSLTPTRPFDAPRSVGGHDNGEAKLVAVEVTG